MECNGVNEQEERNRFCLLSKEIKARRLRSIVGILFEIMREKNSLIKKAAFFGFVKRPEVREKIIIDPYSLYRYTLCLFYMCF